VRFKVETIKGEKFVKLGFVDVTIEEAEEAIERTHDIKENGLWAIAKRKARAKWPDAPVIIVTYLSNK